MIVVTLGATSAFYVLSLNKGTSSSTALPAGCTKPANGFLIVASNLGYNDSELHYGKGSWPILNVTQGSTVNITICNTANYAHGFQYRQLLPEHPCHHLSRRGPPRAPIRRRQVGELPDLLLDPLPDTHLHAIRGVAGRSGIIRRRTGPDPSSSGSKDERAPILNHTARTYTAESQTCCSPRPPPTQTTCFTCSLRSSR